MLVIPVKEGESIERSLKKFKRKFEKTGAMRQLRARKQYVKPPVGRRKEMKKARYVQGLRQEEEGQISALLKHYNEIPVSEILAGIFYARDCRGILKLHW